VLHDKLTTTPATYVGEAKTAAGAQLRDWWACKCNNEGLTSGKTTGPCPPRRFVLCRSPT
jgi:hypothetical protein